MSSAFPLLRDKTHAEEVVEVYRSVVAGVLGAAVSSVGLATVFIRLGITDRDRGVLFASFICACAAIHIGLRIAFARDAGARGDWRFWGYTFAAIAFVEGVGWGWSPLGLVTNGDFAAELISLFVTLTIAVGSILAFGAYRPAFLALFLPATMPAMVSYAFSANELQRATAFLLVIYVVAMGTVGFFANRAFHRTLELRLRAETLAESLRDQMEIAETANRAKSSFLAAASHDLRQPVHALGLFVGALRGMAMSPDATRILERIEVSTQALDSLFSALLDISRLDAGVVEVNLRAFPLAPMLERICRDYAKEAQDKGVGLVLVRGAVALKSDPILVERILRNLVSNAVRYTETGRVLVGCRRDSVAVRVEVWDTGPGISRDQHEQIFQEYYQLGNAERDRAKGLGLGLAIVRRLTLLLECPLTLRSTPGRGSCFAVTIPRAGAVVVDETRPLEADPHPQPMPRRLIVVIDDEIEILAAMSTLLERWGHRVIAAEGGTAAIRRLADMPMRPDLIITDFRLRQGETGLQVIEALRLEYNAVIPAILITGDTAPERLVEARDSGLLILHKPVSNSRLRAALTNSLAATLA